MSTEQLVAFGIIAATCIVALVVGPPPVTVATVVVGLVTAFAIVLNRNFLFSAQSRNGHKTHVAVNGPSQDDSAHDRHRVEAVPPVKQGDVADGQVQLPDQKRRTPA